MRNATSTLTKAGTRAVVYARYSSDSQRDASIEDQIRLCLERIEREGWHYLHAYADRAASGASLLRAGYQELIEGARRGEFDVVVAEALDRLSRDQEDVAALYKRLRFAGVKLVTLAEGEISELHVGLKGTMNALFLKDLAEKTRRGLRGRIEAGRSGGGNAYGYRVVRELDGNGLPVAGGRAIHEAEALVVRRIMTEYAAGKSPRAIAFGLNDDAVPAPGGRAWGPSTINGNRDRGTGILNNEIYIGRLVWNRLHYAKDPSTGRRVSRANGPDSVITKNVPELRIVDDALWQAVKARQSKVMLGKQTAQTAPFWDRTRPRYIVSGLARCGCCGSTFVKISSEHFGCAGARNKGSAFCSNLLTIRRDDLENTIIDGLRHRLMDPDLFKVFMAEFISELNRVRREQQAGSDGIEAELRQIERRVSTLVNAIADGAPGKSLFAELSRLETRQEALGKKLTAATADPVPVALHPNLAEVYRAKVANLNAALTEPSTRDEAFEIIRSLIEKITLVPVDGALRVEIRGELAGILALTAQAESRKPGSISADGLSVQIKMVAGTGFEPVTFRL